LTLTKFSGYSLRLLIYLGLHDDRSVSVAESGEEHVPDCGLIFFRAHQR
jgi:DNA-binding IscR family transcriptional regulator